MSSVSASGWMSGSRRGYSRSGSPDVPGGGHGLLVAGSRAVAGAHQRGQQAWPLRPVRPALARAWHGPGGARLAQVVKACWVEPLDEGLAKTVGELLGRAGTSDVIDAAVVAAE